MRFCIGSAYQASGLMKAVLVDHLEKLVVIAIVNVNTDDYWSWGIKGSL